MLLTCGFAILALALYYRNKRNEDLTSEALSYYQALTQKLNSSIRRQKQLTALLAHDLRSPLAGMISSAHALELAGKNLSNPFIECLQLMQTSGRTNLRLLTNFVELLCASDGRQSNALPDNRLDLLRGLTEPVLLEQQRITWTQAPWKLKTETPIRGLSAALSELISCACSSSKDGHVSVEETFNSEQKVLLVSISGLPAVTENCLVNTNTPGVNPSFQLALEVLKNLGVSVSTIDQSEEKASVELSLPISEFLADNDESAFPPVDEREIRARLLLELSVLDVQSAALSVQSLEHCDQIELVNDEPTEEDASSAHLT